MVSNTGPFKHKRSILSDYLSVIIISHQVLTLIMNWSISEKKIRHEKERYKGNRIGNSNSAPSFSKYILSFETLVAGISTNNFHIYLICIIIYVNRKINTQSWKQIAASLCDRDAILLLSVKGASQYLTSVVL